MPLIIITGFPCSGKSTRCAELVSYLKSSGVASFVNVISEEKFISDRNHIYASSALEKDVRSAVKSQLTSSLTAESWTIIDALNYIKGYRYELYCIAKQNRCCQTTVHCAVDDQLAWQWNCARSPPECRYNRTVFDELVARYERPCADNRWDKPLVQLMPEQATPCALLVELVTSASRPRPNQSTEQQSLTSADTISSIDMECRRFIDELLRVQVTAVDGESVRVGSCNESLQLPRRLNLAQLSRYRRQFVSFMRSRPQQTGQMPHMFVQYLNSVARQL